MSPLRPTARLLLSLLLVLGLSLAVTGAVLASNADASAAARDEIIQVVETSYIHGAFNEQNTEAMRAGFDPIFKIHGARNGELSTYPIADWISSIEKAKAAADYVPEIWEHRFPMIDITGDAAVVKVELFKVEGAQNNHVYTDYLSLLKLENGWKITEVYHRH